MEDESTCMGNGAKMPAYSKECTKHLLPVRDALDALNGKWKIPIIIALSFGNYRFRELHRQIDGITTKMLSKELKEMEMNGLIERTVYDSFPVSVEYSLTSHGKSLRPLIKELEKWGDGHRKHVHKAAKKERLKN